MTPPRDQTLLDRIATWLGVARDTAYRMWKWQENEAILVSTHSSRAWRCTVQPIKDGTEERVEVVEISRETGEPALKDEPESYAWQPTVFQNEFEQGRIRPADTP
jgi:hypothetical protein